MFCIISIRPFSVAILNGGFSCSWNSHLSVSVVPVRFLFLYLFIRNLNSICYKVNIQCDKGYNSSQLKNSTTRGQFLYLCKYSNSKHWKGIEMKSLSLSIYGPPCYPQSVWPLFSNKRVKKPKINTETYFTVIERDYYVNNSTLKYMKHSFIPTLSTFYKTIIYI